jgi:hypothetical protein
MRYKASEATARPAIKMIDDASVVIVCFLSLTSVPLAFALVFALASRSDLSPLLPSTPLTRRAAA